MAFGDLLRQLRLATGLGIKRLAPELGVNYTYLSKLENNQIGPSEQLVGRVAKYFEYDRNQLLLSAGKVPTEILEILRATTPTRPSNYCGNTSVENVPNNVDAFLRIVESRRDIDGRFSGVRRVGPAGGNGAFSLVFRATDQSSGQDVALKVFRPDCTIPYRIACFEREAQILETLRGQPDIIGWVATRSSFVELTTTSTGIMWPITFEYYALELAVSDIGSIIENGGWNIEQTLQSFHVMCRAVQRIHLRGITHRDLKPSNFLVMPDGSVKLSDFGTARDLSGMPNAILTNYAGPPGDTRYASPEMVTCLHDEDPQIAFHGDIFSLGSILFELVTRTCLGVILDPQFHRDLSDLFQAMSIAPQRDRRRIYDQVIGQIADSYPLPGLLALGARIPAAVIDHVERLYKSMAALSYRARLADFNQIFRAIRICLIILRNDQQYRRWRANREKYRRDREERQRQLASRARFILKGN